MIRFHIIFRRTGVIFDPHGMAERIIAATGNATGQVTVYVNTKNRERFEKLLLSNREVLEYTQHPVDIEARIESLKKAK